MKFRMTWTKRRVQRCRQGCGDRGRNGGFLFESMALGRREFHSKQRQQRPRRTDAEGEKHEDEEDEDEGEETGQQEEEKRARGEGAEKGREGEERGGERRHGKEREGKERETGHGEEREGKGRKARGREAREGRVNREGRGVKSASAELATTTSLPCAGHLRLGAASASRSCRGHRAWGRPTPCG